MKAASRFAALDALASPARQELVSHLGEGAATVHDLARRLGRTRQSLYYHLQALERAGLVRVSGTRGEGRGAERVYEVVARAAGGEQRALSKRERGAAARATAAMLRLTQREFVAAAHGDDCVPGDPGVALIAIRAKARLDAASLKKVRALLEELTGIFRAAKGKHHGERPFALTMVLTPARESSAASPAAASRRRTRGS